MIYRFNAYGHPNILGTHKTTFEFTKDSELSLNGDCIVGIKADFELEKIKEFIQTHENRMFSGHQKSERFFSESKTKKISIIIKTPDGKIQEEINAELNLNFNSDREMVIRKTDFISERTFAIKADKAARDMDNEMIALMKEKNNRIIIFIVVK